MRVVEALNVEKDVSSVLGTELILLGVTFVCRYIHPVLVAGC